MDRKKIKEKYVEDILKKTNLVLTNKKEMRLCDISLGYKDSITFQVDNIYMNCLNIECFYGNFQEWNDSACELLFIEDNITNHFLGRLFKLADKKKGFFIDFLDIEIGNVSDVLLKPQQPTKQYNVKR